MNTTGLSAAGLLEALAAQLNEDATDFNNLVDELETERTELALCRSVREADQRQIKALQQELAECQQNEAAFKAQLLKDQKALNEAQDALAKAQKEIARLKDEAVKKKAASDLITNDLKKQLQVGDPKTQALIKRLKREKEDLQADVDAQRATIAKLRGEFANEVKARKAAEHHSAQSTMYTVKATETGMLMYFPKQVVGTCENVPMEVQRSLLYIHRTSGRGGLITLDGDGQPIMGHPPKNGLRVEKELEDFAGAWLRKVKSQGNVVLPEDFAALGG